MMLWTRALPSCPRIVAAWALAFFAFALTCAFCVVPAKLALADDATQGSVTVHKLCSAQPGGAGTGSADDVLPSDAQPIPGARLTLEMLSDDPTAADGDAPQITVDSPALPGFAAREAVTDGDGVALWDGLSRGVYRVTETDAAGFVPAQRAFLVSVPRAADAAGGAPNWDVHVFPKSTRTAVVSKAPAAEQPAVVGVGDEVRWVIDHRIPDGLKAVSNGAVLYGKNWQVYDDMDPRLDWGSLESMRVYAADGSQLVLGLEAGRDFSESYDANKHRVTWEFTQEALQKVADSGAVRLVLDVRTVVSERAFASVSPLENAAGISFTNAWGDPVEFDTGEGGAAQVSTGGAVVDKFLDSDGRKLAGAEFMVAKTREDAAAGRHLTYADGSPLVLRTDDNGAAQIGGLQPGEWWITEVKAPTLADGSECVRLVESAMFRVGDTADSSVVPLQVANRVEGPLDQVANGIAGVFPKTSDAALAYAAAAIVLAALLLVALRRSAKRRAEHATVSANTDDHESR